MTYYIIDKKTNDFSKTFGFAVTVAVAACNSFYIYTSSTPSAFFVTCLLSIPCPLHLHLRLRLRLYLRLLSLGCLLCLYFLWLIPSISVVFISSDLFVAYLLSVPRLLHLHLYLLCLGCPLNLWLLWLVLSTSAICALSARLFISFIACLLFMSCQFRLYLRLCLHLLYLDYLLRLQLLWFIPSSSVVCTASTLFASSMACLLSISHPLHLHFLWFVCYACTLSISFVTRLLFVPYPLCLRLLCLY